MALDDGGIKGEQHFLEPMPCGSENLSPYSNTSGYSDTPTYYPTDYDWQQEQQHPNQLHHQPPPPTPQQHQQQQHPQHLPPHHIHDSNIRYYGTFPDSAIDMNASSYPNFSHHSLGQSEYFPNGHGLWTVAQPDPIASNTMASHPRFFSGVDLSQQAPSPQMVGSAGSNGKPKRKRVQSHSQRKAANVRERRRMFHLNEAFDELRKRLPAFNYEKRLSRIETLRLAMTYISFMKEVSVGGDPKLVKLKPHGADLSGLPMSLNGSSLFAALENAKDDVSLDSDDCSSNDVPNMHATGN